jgi:L-arabinose isomerase
MRSPFEQKELWFLTGSQDLYGDETLRQVAEQSQQVAATLDAAGRRTGPRGLETGAQGS